VDEEGQNVRNGEAGELLVKGPNIMMGYYKDQAATDKALIDGWLHTGDLAYMKEGLLYIKGRKDDLIIYAGMNIYPAEIENALREDLHVQEVLAYGIPDKLCGQTVGLKIVGDFSTKSEIVDLCNRMLPPYARPKVIEWVDSLPKNGSGKILRSRNDITN
jgi:long-chain acyl-CoA synthetase